MIKNAYFGGKKTVKIVSVSGAPPPDPRFVTPAYYYNFVEFVSNAKCIIIPLKKETSNYSKCSAFASSALLPIFHSNSLSFVERGARIFLAPGRRVP